MLFDLFRTKKIQYNNHTEVRGGKSNDRKRMSSAEQRQGTGWPLLLTQFLPTGPGFRQQVKEHVAQQAAHREAEQDLQGPGAG